ncbi:MAG: hypothetical protein KKB37_04450 [Alphaproteobacteria bacterium]|nr:hypothetical protein [Alphaproteobacteria bacterium]
MGQLIRIRPPRETGSTDHIENVGWLHAELITPVSMPRSIRKVLQRERADLQKVASFAERLNFSS